MRAAAAALIAVLPATLATTNAGGSPIAAQEPPAADTSADTLARDAIQDYWKVLFDAAVGPVQSARPEACRGSTLRECFGGELHCAWWGRMCDATPHGLARARLLTKLSALQERFPENDFVVGQLVEAALKDGDPYRALNAAERCAATRWWCQALRGYARHALEPGSGDLQFDSALASAPADAPAFGFEPHPLVIDRGLACEWTHAGHLWPDGLPEEWNPNACGEAPEPHERFWWLSDPLWSAPGNARWGEHVSRTIRARLLYELEWRDFSPRLAPQWWWAPFNLHQEWTRNGFYNSWRPIVRIHQARPDTTHQLYVHGGYSFAPDADRLLRPETSTTEDWAVAWDEGPERMHWGAAWHPIAEHQTAVLRRGQGLVALTAARLPVLVSSFDGVEGALAMGRPSDRVLETGSADIDHTGVMRARLPVPHGAWVASVEARGPGWAGRARFGAPAPALEDGVGISPPLLVEPDFEPETDSLEQALLPSTTLSPRRLGVYFELYGIEEGEAIELTLSVERTDRSLLGRIGGLFGLSQSSSLSVAWTETTERPQAEGYIPRLTQVDLHGLDAGTYRLSIEIAGDGGASVSTSLPVTLRAAP